MNQEKWYRWGIRLWWAAIGALAWLDFFKTIQVTGPSPKWGAASLVFLLVVLAWWLGHLWPKKGVTRMVRRLPSRLRGMVWLTALVGYVIFFQYTDFGIIFTGYWLRLYLWCVLIELGVFWRLEWGASNRVGVVLTMILLSGAVFVLAAAFREISAYPFGLGWSEGNRMWDFSLLFGRHLYNYPVDQPIPALIDFGRQLMWGAIFLLPHPSIVLVRFWNALMFTLPLLLFGWLLFRRAGGRLWWLAGIWAFVFLYQGPIYTQLIVSAILVTIAWRRPLWLGAPLLTAAGYFAQISRWTWLFAPAIWIVMLELGGASLDEEGRLPRRAWRRAAFLGGAGVLGGYVLPVLGRRLAAASPTADLGEAVARVSRQPLLWYRLFPNPTYAPGILLGLLGVIVPVLLWLFWVQRHGWRLNGWQRLVLGGALLAFLAVGLVASTKIGGGSNLHNLDMFLIGLVFVVALSWQVGGDVLAVNWPRADWRLQGVLLLLVLQPVWRAPLALRPLRYNPSRVGSFYLDAALPANLPPEKDVQQSLETIKDLLASVKGEVLFMDQRQLLTFGYVPSIPLVPEYEKKRLMNQAMGNDAAYFAAYYEDLKNKRFALIVSEPLRVRYQQPGKYSFAEENNAWVRWVAEPTLCYYRPIATLDEVQVQLLVPRRTVDDCDLPVEP